MIAPNSIVIVSLLDELPNSDEIVRSEWPQHITLIPWFQYQDTEKLIANLETFAVNQKLLRQTVGDLELFGPERTIPVNVIRDQEPVKNLHERLAGLLRQLGVDFEEPEWMLDNYRAHITRFVANEDHYYKPGDEIELTNMCLVQLTSPTTTRILKVIEFGYEAAA